MKVAVYLAPLLLTGCGTVDGVYLASNCKLHLLATDASSYSIQLSSNDTSTQSVPHDGRIEVNIPEQRWGQLRIGSIPISPANARPTINVLRGDRVIARLKLSSIEKLPRDRDGYALVYVN